MSVGTAVTALLGSALALMVAGCSQAPPSSPPQMPTPTPTLTVPPLNGTLSLADLRMVSATTGWALAVPGDGHGLSRLLRTTDAGAHWNAIGLPPDLDSPNLDAVDFHDADHAWVLVVLGAESTGSAETSVVASTADEGKTWVTSPRLVISGAANAIQFLDAAHGWVFATPGAGGAIGAGDTTLYRTVDGGSHWQVIKPPSEVRGDPSVIGGLPDACPMGGPLGRPTFVDPTTGWLGAFCNRSFFYLSQDGGLSWHRQNLPPFPGPASTVPAADLLYNVDSFQQMSASDFSIVLHRGITTGGNALQEAALYVTHDAGASWAGIRLPYAELADDFVDPLHGWMIAAGPGGDTERRSLYATVDGGQAWRLADGPQSYFNHDLNFVDTMTGFLVDQPSGVQSPQLLRTTDGGNTWTRMTPVVN